ncbi:MAG: Crp/Fnr family transcriptional regulator [Methylotenera sp.]|nr:Crp/Fnr family transcriptional regulator [Methylotenera sp.]
MHNFVSPVNKNRLINKLPLSELAQFLKACDLVTLHAQEILNSPNSKIEYVYFPINSVIALSLTTDGKSIETGLIGNDGMLGITLFLCVQEAPCTAFVQIEGEAYRIQASKFLDEVNKSTALRKILSRYLLVLMNRLALAVGCHHFHSTEKRLAYLILIIHDTTHSKSLNITQELLSNLLGVRRVSITEAARHLQQRHIIQYSRGRITILDMPLLVAESCSCFNTYHNYYHCIDDLIN